MHHSQLEYLVAVQKLQRQDRGAKGYEVAEYLNVSPAYAVKLNVYAESQGYILRDRARTIRLTLLGEQVMEEYLTAARSMGKFLCSCGADEGDVKGDEGDVKGDAVRCVCALTDSTRQALVKAHTAQNG